jgi:hypothetical protein
MSFSVFPNEIYIMTTDEVFNSQTTFHSARYDVNSSLYLAIRAQRLEWLRSLASVYRAQVNSVRTAFWEEVALFAIQELVVLARAVENTSAKPACIRRLYLRAYSPSDFKR